MTEQSSESLVANIIGKPIDAALGALVGWLFGRLTESPAGSVIFLVVGVICGLFFRYIVRVICGVLFRYYIGVLGAGAAQEGSLERKDYDDLRESLAEGGWARHYARLLTGFLDRVDRFFGDAGMADQVLFPRAFWPFRLKKASSLWTAPALDRCLLLAVIYPVATIFVIWTISGHVGPAEVTLHLEPNLSWWRRGLVAAMVGVLVFALWRSMRVKGWKVFACLTGAFAGVVVFIVFLALAGVFIGASAEAVGVALAVAIAIALSGAVAIAGVFTIVFFGATVFAVAGIFNGAGTITDIFPVAGIFAIALVVAIAVAVVVAIINKRAIEKRRQGVFFVFLLPALIVACLVAANLLASREYWGEVTGPMLLFLGLLTLINAPFDWASLGLTRALLRRGLERAGWWPYLMAFVDAVFAAVTVAVLAIAMVIGVQAYDDLAAYGGGARILPLEPLLNGIAAHPTAPEYWWVYALLLSTMIPSLINLGIGGTSFWRWVLRDWLLRNIPVGKAVPDYRRELIAGVLTLQVVGGAILGIAAQALLVVVVIGYCLPKIGFGVLYIGHEIATMDPPMRVLRYFGASGVPNSSDFELRVDALSNCLDIQKKSIPHLASSPISNGKYKVELQSADAHYCGLVSSCYVQKVMIYFTTNSNPEGWFKVVDQSHPTYIEVSGIGTDANIVYAFYIDTDCGDNTGGSVLHFTAAVP